MFEKASRILRRIIFGKPQKSTITFHLESIYQAIDNIDAIEQSQLITDDAPGASIDNNIDMTNIILPRK